MKISYLHGHKIVFRKNRWIYADTKEPTINNPYRECKKCGAEIKESDGCLGKLPGVVNACCGHGKDEGYIQFENGTIVRGIFKEVQRKTVNEMRK